MKRFFADLTGYLKFLKVYFQASGARFFSRFESHKDRLVGSLTSQRGRWVRPFIHSGVIGLVLVGVTIGPHIVQEARQQSLGQLDGQAGGAETGTGIGGAILGISTTSWVETVATQISEKPRAEVVEYQIQPGDTVSQLAEKFGISEDTIYWENDVSAKTKLNPGDYLRILPVTGVRHTVGRGETVHSIAKKYDISPQALVDYPFNSFVNDETFQLAVGQTLIVPDGVKPDEIPVSPRRYLARQTPDAGSVTASGSWVWPASGQITQRFVWYHPGIDIANKAGPVVVAADAGTVVAVLSQRWAYGNHVIIDHGNGFQTLYAHLSGFRVSQGQTVAKGAPVGMMGSSGRSTGVHLHFEIRKGGVAVNPLSYLK